MKSKSLFRRRWIRAAVVLLLVIVLLAIPFSVAFAQSGEPNGQAEGIPKLTADLLVTVTGAVLSILAYIIPPFKRLQMRMGEWTPAFMAGCLLITALVYQTLWCAYDMACVVANWQSVLLIWGTAFGVNSGMYSAAIKPAKENAVYRLVNPGNWQG
jgi:hypothetical protein